MGRPELHCCVAPPRPPSRPARASAADDQSRNRAVCLFVPSALAPAAAAAAARVCINTGLDALAVELAGRERRREAPTADASARGAAATSLMMMMCIRQREKLGKSAKPNTLAGKFARAPLFGPTKLNQSFCFISCKI